jgi:peptidoglycan/LPS O-acetylase OafA/YrhL
MVPIAGHMWSLCLEVQFYAAIAILFLVLRERSLALLPVLCVAATLNRMLAGQTQDIATLYRVDDILGGAALAYLYHGSFAPVLRRMLEHLHPAIPLALLGVASHPSFLGIGQFRPYFASAAIGATLFQRSTRFNRLLESRPLAYLASISYALYIWHPLTTHGWFDPAGKMAKYLRRPLGIGLSLLLAHVSTRFFESYFIRLGKRLTNRRSVEPSSNAAPDAIARETPSAQLV